MELNKIPQNPNNWGNVADILNENSGKIEAETAKLSNATTKFKGYFSTSTALSAKWPSPLVGDTAWVGATYPGVVYRCDVAGTWLATTDVPPSNTVNLSEYATQDAVSNEFASVRSDLNKALYDVSSHNDGAVFESLQALLSSSSLSTLIPTSVRHGGMSIRFVHSSDNKYVQFRLMADSFSTTVTDWQGVDDEPTAGSNNLVKSGGVLKSFKRIDLATTDIYYGILAITTDFEIVSATLKQYYNRDKTSLPAQSSQVLRIDFVSEYYDALAFIYTYEGGAQLSGIQELTNTISGHTITIRVDWQPINTAPDISIDVTRIINTTNYNAKIQEKYNSFIFKDSSILTDFGIKSIYTDFNFDAIRLYQYYNRDKTGYPAQSSQVLVFYVLINGTEERFAYTYEGGLQKSANEDITISLNGRNIYINLDWKPVNQELSNYYLLKGNIQQLYKLPTEVIKESDFSLVPRINIANLSNIIGKAAIDVREGILVIRDNLEGNFVIKINVSEGQVISFGHFTLGMYGAYTFYNGTTPTGNFSTFLDPQGGKAATVTVPNGADILYFQVHVSDYPSADYSEIMANIGSTLANYEPFEVEITKIKGYKIKGTGESQGQSLSQLVIDLPISDGTDIQSGYAYIDSSNRNIKVKA